MRSILVVDDEPYWQKIFQTHRSMLEASSPHFLFACHGLDALKILLIEPSIDLVVTDLHMPHMGGIDLLENIQIFFPHKRSVVLSGSRDPLLRQRAFRHGIEKFLHKPVCLKALKTILSPRGDGVKSEAYYACEIMESGFLDRFELLAHGKKGGYWITYDIWKRQDRIYVLCLLLPSIQDQQARIDSFKNIARHLSTTTQDLDLMHYGLRRFIKADQLIDVVSPASCYALFAVDLERLMLAGFSQGDFFIQPAEEPLLSPLTYSYHMQDQDFAIFFKSSDPDTSLAQTVPLIRFLGGARS